MITRLPVITPTVVILNFAEGIPWGDSGSRKGNTCYSTAKFFGDYNYLSYPRFFQRNSFGSHHLPAEDFSAGGSAE
jgi:hypothetical protein